MTSKARHTPVTYDLHEIKSCENSAPVTLKMCGLAAEQEQISREAMRSGRSSPSDVHVYGDAIDQNP